MGRPTDQERREAVKTLAERHGITKVDGVYDDGETLLSRAAGCESCLDLLRLLIAAGADVNHANADGCTSLYHACTAFNTEGARLLVEGGADVNAATREGETPLMNAALDAAEAAGSRECTRLLQRAGAARAAGTRFSKPWRTATPPPCRSLLPPTNPGRGRKALGRPGPRMLVRGGR